MKNILILTLLQTIFFLTGCFDTYEKSLCENIKEDYPYFKGSFLTADQTPEKLEISHLSEGVYQMKDAPDHVFKVMTCKMGEQWFFEALTADLGFSEDPNKDHVSKYILFFINYLDMTHFKSPLKPENAENWGIITLSHIAFDQNKLNLTGIPFQVYHHKMDDKELSWIMIDNTQVEDPKVLLKMTYFKGEESDSKPFAIRLYQP